MALKLELNMKHVQQLVMTPQLQMAIRLLQLTRMELTEMVTQEMEENPTLEDASLESDADQDMELEKLLRPKDGQELIKPPENADSNEMVAYDLEKQIRESEPKQPEMDWDNYFDTYLDGPADIRPRDTGGDERPGFEQFLTKENTLYDYLIWQLRFSSLPSTLFDIGEEIIGNIDEKGYLKNITLEEIAAGLNRPIEEVERVHRQILRFDPLGVGSRDLRECLLVQSKFGNLRDPVVSRIIQDHWGLVEKRDIVKLARSLKISRHEVEAAMRIIVSLDPRPGSRYSSEQAEYIIPDIFVHRIGDDYVIVLNESGLPKLRVNEYYQRTLADKRRPKEARDFIKNKLRSATWLIRSIHQRQRTIHKVAESIVTKQRDFLDNGVNYLKPMILRDVAEDIGMHECTVSRVTTNKYIHTPQGIFELKYFFNSGITNTQGEDISSETIKTKIKRLIEREDARNPLSDQKIVKLLREEEVDVARRTVAKYREMLGILSSSGRRRKF